MSLTAPALLTYLYLPLATSNGKSGYARLDALWRRIAEDFGLDRPVDGLGVATDMPTEFAQLDRGGSWLVAARENRGAEVWQAWVRVEHNVSCLGLMMAPPRTDDCAVAWQELERRLDRVVTPERSDDILGESRLFLALTTESATAVAEGALRAAVPSSTVVGWWRAHDSIRVGNGAGKVNVWELGAGADDRPLRRLVVLAPPENESDMDHLVWTSGDGELTRLARYLMHAAKLRYQIRVFNAGRDCDRVCQQLDALEGELFHAEGVDRGHVLAALAKAQSAAVTVRSRIARMRDGVSAITENLDNALHAELVNRFGGPTDDDRLLATWFAQRLDDEGHRLAEATAHIQSVLATTVPPSVPDGAPTRPTDTMGRGRSPLVFVCYIHESDQHKNDVLRFATFLREHGIDAQLDLWFLDERRDWYPWALDLISRADFVVVIASPLCRVVGDGHVADHLNLGGQSEMALLRELTHRERTEWTRKILPVLLPGRTAEEIPLFLQGYAADHYLVSEFTAAGANDLLRMLSGQPRHHMPRLRPPVVLPREDDLTVE